MPKMYYKVITFSFLNKDEAVKFLELATKKVKTFQMYGRCKSNNQVEIILQGDPVEVNLAISELKKLAKTIKEMMRHDRGFAIYDISILLDMANLEAAIPLDVVFKIIELKGYKIEVLGGKIKTNASVDEIVRTMEYVSKLYREMMTMDITPQAKRLIAIHSIITGKSIEKSIEELTKYKLLNVHRDEERQLILLTQSYENSVRILKSILKQKQEKQTSQTKEIENRNNTKELEI